MPDTRIAKEDAGAVPMLDVLAPAYGPCPEFQGACAGFARWDPKHGHVPRGFLGARAGLEKVRLVILVAEPGDPHEGCPPFPSKGAADIAEAAMDHTHECLDSSRDSFHRNLRHILDLLLPGTAFSDQLAKVWITDTYLCSALKEAGPVGAARERACADRYLRRMLERLPGRPLLALGRKANPSKAVEAA